MDVCFENTHFVLILNKCDIFQKWFFKFGLGNKWIYKERNYFEGDKGVIQFFLTKFLNKINTKNNKKKRVHCFVSNAIDQKGIIQIMQYVYTEILHH